MYIWAPEGEDYGGITDRHIVVSKKHVVPALSLMNDIILNPKRLYDEMRHKSDWNIEQYIRFHFEKNNLLAKVRRFPRVMYAVRGEKDPTSYSEGKFHATADMLVKYDGELAATDQTVVVYKTPDDWLQHPPKSQINQEFLHLSARAWFELCFVMLLAVTSFAIHHRQNRIDDLFFFLYAVLAFQYLKLKTGRMPTSAGLTALIFLNPLLVSSKQNFLPDFAFSFFGLFSLYLLERMDQRRRLPVIAGLCIGFTVWIHTLGIALIAAVPFTLCLKFYQKRRKGDQDFSILKQGAIALCSALLLVLFLFRMFPAETTTPLRSEADSDAAGVFYYLDLLGKMFPWIPPMFTRWGSRLVCVLAGGGLLANMFRKGDFSQFFLICYAVLLLTRQTTNTFASLLPVLPLLAFYSFYALQRPLSQKYVRAFCYVAILMVLTAFYIPQLIAMAVSK